MALIYHDLFPRLKRLPATMPDDGSITIRLEEGVPVFQAAHSVQARIELLVRKQRTANLTTAEIEELEQYEEIDDYLSYLNRLVRNMLQADATPSPHS
jgi:hypothetical protein